MPDNTCESVIGNNTVTTDTPAKPRKKHSEPMILKLLQFAFKTGGTLSPLIASRFAYNLWLTPPRFKTPAAERHALESAVIEYHSISKLNIATFIWGQTEAEDQPSILLVHGWSGRGTQLCSFIEPLIEAGYRVISFDAPAHGKSSGKQTNIYEIADVILALQDHYGAFESVITHSFGGPCTAQAVKQGLKIKRFVSICPPATTIGLVTKFVSALHITEKTSTRLVNRIEQTFGKNIWHELSMVNTVKKIDVSGFVIHDTHDTDIPWEEGQAVAFSWNNAPFKITNGLGHRRILRDKTVAEAAVKFITD